MDYKRLYHLVVKDGFTGDVLKLFGEANKDKLIYLTDLTKILKIN